VHEIRVPDGDQFASSFKYTRRRTDTADLPPKPRTVLLLNVDVEAADPDPIPLTHRWKNLM